MAIYAKTMTCVVYRWNPYHRFILPLFFLQYDFQVQMSKGNIAGYTSASAMTPTQQYVPHELTLWRGGFPAGPSFGLGALVACDWLFGVGLGAAGWVGTGARSLSIVWVPRLGRAGSR